jgi:Tfp pilus assembly protein PilO
LVWPGIVLTGNLTKTLEEKQKVLDNHNSEKDKIASLKNSIDQNKNNETTILSYLPAQKNEENIVNSVNYLATNSSVSLNELSLTEAVGNQTKVSNSNKDNSASSSKEILFSSSSSGVPNKKAVANKVNFINSKISIAGNYQNIKIFLSKIYNMPIFNKINSTTISKIEGASPASANNSVAADANIDLLKLDMDVSFGYEPTLALQESSALPSFPGNTFDFSYVKKIEDYSMKVAPITDSGLGLPGRENPFLP